MVRRRCGGIRLWLLLGGAAAGGCGTPDASGPAGVRGSASFHGHPLTGGTVVFVPDRERGTDGELFTATVDANGAFQLADGAKSVPPGWYRVALAEPPDWYGLEPNGSAFPAALRRPDKSGIECEVLAGKDNVFDFAVELTE